MSHDAGLARRLQLNKRFAFATVRDTSAANRRVQVNAAWALHDSLTATSAADWREARAATAAREAARRAEVEADVAAAVAQGAALSGSAPATGRPRADEGAAAAAAERSAGEPAAAGQGDCLPALDGEEETAEERLERRRRRAERKRLKAVLREQLRGGRKRA